MRQGRSSRSAKSKWWPIRAPMWTRRFTATSMGRTSPNCRWSRSWTWMASWCGMPGGRSAAPHSAIWICAARLCWYTPAGTGDRLKPVLPFPGDAQRTPLAVLVVFGKQHDLSHVARVVRDLAADGLHHGVGFAADRDAAAEVCVRQRLERAEHAIPARLPKRHQHLAGGRRLLELGVAMAVRLLSIGGQEVRPARAHVAGHVLNNDGNRICFGVERGEKLLVGDLRHSAFGELLVLAEQGQRFFQV